MMNIAKWIVLWVIAWLAVLGLSPNFVNGYEVTSQFTTQWVTTTYANWVSATEVCKNETRVYSRDLNESDVSHIMDKLSVREFNMLRDYILWEARCIEPKQVTKEQSVVVSCEMPAVCWDNKVNQTTEECDWQSYCSNNCKILKIEEPVYTPEVFVMPDVVTPVGWCDLSDPKCIIKLRNLYGN